MEALMIQMALEIGTTIHQRKEALQGLDIREVLIGRGDDATGSPTFHGSFDVFEQQNKASLFDKADRKAKR